MRRLPLLQSLVICLCLSSYPGWAQNEAAPSTSDANQEKLNEALVTAPLPNLSQRLPMGELHINGQTAMIPDWRIITFESFPAFPADGSWGEMEWSKGERLADVLTLGDFQGSLDLHILTIASIGETLGLPASGRKSPLYDIALSEFRLLERQTIASLVVAVPSLLEMPVEKLSLIQDLVRSVEPTFIFRDKTLEELLETHPEFGEIKLSPQILEDYTLSDLPGMELVPLQSFGQWEEATINEVPLLSQTSWWLFPGKPDIDGEIAVAAVQEPADGADYRLMLTPQQPHLRPIEWELGEEEMMPAPANGKLSQINDGKEYVGAFPFGQAFKLVPQEATADAVHVALYFRTCRESQGRLDCSPYGIGPIPFATYRPDQTIFVGEGVFPLAAVETPAPVQPQPVAAPETEAFFDVVVETASEHKGPISTVIIILVLAGGTTWWALKGDPIQFCILTFRWAIASQMQRRIQRSLKRQLAENEVASEHNQGEP